MQQTTIEINDAFSFDSIMDGSTQQIKFESVEQTPQQIEQMNNDIKELNDKADAKQQSVLRKQIFWRNVGFIAHIAFELHKLFPSDTFDKHKTKINYLYRGMPKELKPADWAWKYAESQYKTMLKF